jgi:hypothetical protein
VSDQRRRRQQPALRFRGSEGARWKDSATTFLRTPQPRQSSLTGVAADQVFHSTDAADNFHLKAASPARNSGRSHPGRRPTSMAWSPCDRSGTRDRRREERASTLEQRGMADPPPVGHAERSRCAFPPEPVDVWQRPVGAGQRRNRSTPPPREIRATLPGWSDRQTVLSSRGPEPPGRKNALRADPAGTFLGGSTP